MGYTISDVVDPVVVPKPHIEFRRKVESLPVGKALIIAGMKQSNLASRAAAIGRQSNPPKKFTTASLRDGRFQLVHTA